MKLWKTHDRCLDCDGVGCSACGATGHQQWAYYAHPEEYPQDPIYAEPLVAVQRMRSGDDPWQWWVIVSLGTDLQPLNVATTKRFDTPVEVDAYVRHLFDGAEIESDEGMR